MKKSTKQYPLRYFDWYFSERIYTDYYDLKEGKIYLNLDGVDYFKWDNKKESLFVTFINPNLDNPTPVIVEDIFEERIKNFLQSEIDKSTDFIESELRDIYSNKYEVKAHVDFYKKKLNAQKDLPAITKFPFLKFYFDAIEKVLNYYSNSGKSTTEACHSYNLLAENATDLKRKLDKLYDALTTPPPLIECSKSEFENAFTGKDLNEGIKWLVKGKNKMISKQSLFYFIEQLEANGHLSNSIYSDLNNMYKYVFRNDEGEIINYFGSSKSNPTKTPTSKDRIDLIISTL